MSLGGGVDQQFICCSQCRGLFARRKTLLDHKSFCSGNPESSKCDFYAVPFSEYIAWKKDQNGLKSTLEKLADRTEEPLVTEESAEDLVKGTSPKRSNSEVTKEGTPPKLPRRRGRPRKIIPESETTLSSSSNAKDDQKVTQTRKEEETSKESPNKNTCEPQQDKALANTSVTDKSDENSTAIQESVDVSKEVCETENSSGAPTEKESVFEVSVSVSDSDSPNETTKSQQSDSSPKNTNDDKEGPEDASDEEQTTSLVKVPWEAGVDDDCESAASPHPEDAVEAGDVENGPEKENISLQENDSLREENLEPASLVGPNKIIKSLRKENATYRSPSLAFGRKRLEGSLHECSICDYKTKLHGMFVRHMQSHNYGDRFNCDVCGKMFIHRRHFNAHMMTHNRLQCPHCEKLYSRTHDRDRHIKNAHSEEKLLFACTYCEFTTPYPGNFKEHQRKHTGERLFCTKPGCGYKTMYQRALRHHMNSVHATSKDFKCKVCTYQSSTKLGLTKHMVTHSSVRNKQCPHCDYTAKTTGSLRAHIMKHGSEKYYYCDQCSYKTFRSHSFRNHMLIHLGLKPWYCEGCNFDAVTREKVVRHIVSKHGPISKNGPQVCKKDIRVKLNLEAFKRDPTNPEEENDPSYQNSKMVMIEVINESGENVHANFSRHHQIILKDPKNAEEVMEQSLQQSDLTEQQSEDIYKCAMCAYQSDNLGDVEDHINECHGSVAGEEIVMDLEGTTHFDISQENIEIQEATEEEVEEMVYVIAAPGTGEEQSLVIQSKSNEIPDDAVFTAVESILHLQNAPEGTNNIVASS